MGRSKRSLVWVERLAAEPGGKSSWHLMAGRRIIVTLRSCYGSWWGYGSGCEIKRDGKLSLEDAKDKAEAIASTVMAACDRIGRRPASEAMMQIPGRSVFGSDDDDQGLP